MVSVDNSTYAFNTTTYFFTCIAIYEIHTNPKQQKSKNNYILIRFLWFHSVFMTTCTTSLVVFKHALCLHKEFLKTFFLCILCIVYTRNTCIYYILLLLSRHRLINLFGCNFLSCLHSFF